MSGFGCGVVFFIVICGGCIFCVVWRGSCFFGKVVLGSDWFWEGKCGKMSGFFKVEIL